MDFCCTSFKDEVLKALKIQRWAKSTCGFRHRYSMYAKRLASEESISQDFEALSVSKRLVRSGSQKQRKKNNRGGSEEEDDSKGISLRCLSLYSRVGGCKVGADTSEEYRDPCGRRRSNVSDDGRGTKLIFGTEETGVDCFSYGVKERFWRKHNRKEAELEESIRNSRMHIFLPDDILEMCLVKLPLASLMTARLVCKKWRQLTSTPRFLQMRREGLYQNPWLFLFGAVKDGFCSGEIHALDVSFGKWHKIDSNILKGRFMFSVVTIQEEIFIVGGCSSLANPGKVDRSSFKTHKGVIAFNPVTRSWRKVAPMKYSRSVPILGIFEVIPEFSVGQSQQTRQDRRPRTRVGGVSDVYEDPHRLSLRRQNRNSVDENEASLLPNRKSFKFSRSGTKGFKRFLLIAVGGHGTWDEPLDSGEIYDSLSNKWTEIQRLPGDFGAACSGVVCNGIFYVYSDTDKLAGYDLQRGFWIRVQTSPFPSRVYEYNPKLMACSDRLFVLSVSWCEGEGQIGRRNKAVRKLWELDLYYLNWTEVSVHPDAPMDWNASFMADQNLIFGIEMFKIFGQVLDFLTVCDVSDSDSVTGMKWSHISRNYVAHEFDASSCMTKSMAVLHL